jgi:hypothetical protein
MWYSSSTNRPFNIGNASSSSAPWAGFSSTAATINVPVTLASGGILSAGKQISIPDWGGAAQATAVGISGQKTGIRGSSTGNLDLISNGWHDGSVYRSGTANQFTALNYTGGAATSLTSTAWALFSTQDATMAANSDLSTKLVTLVNVTHAGAVTLGPTTTTNAPLIVNVNSTANARYTAFKGGGSSFNLAGGSNITVPIGVSGVDAGAIVLISYGNTATGGTTTLLCGWSDQAKLITSTGTAVTETTTPAANSVGVVYSSTTGSITIYGGSLSSGVHVLRVTILGNG